MQSGFSGIIQDRRLLNLFESLKSKFTDDTNPLLSDPFPDNVPPPVWNPTIGVAAGQANLITRQISIHPEYLMPMERSEKLAETMLHEMLHIYVWHYYKCDGHRREWKMIADQWGMNQFHILCKYHGLAPNRQDKNIYEVIGQAEKLIHSPTPIIPTRFRKIRRLP